MAYSHNVLINIKSPTSCSSFYNIFSFLFAALEFVDIWRWILVDCFNDQRVSFEVKNVFLKLSSGVDLGVAQHVIPANVFANEHTQF